MEWTFFSLVIIVLILFIRRTWRHAQQQAARDLIAATDAVSSALMTREAQEDFKSALPLASVRELRQALVAGMQTELEGVRAEQIFAASDDLPMLASTRADLQQVRIRLGWIRDECAARGIVV